MAIFKQRKKQSDDCIFCDTAKAQKPSGSLDGNIYDCPICGYYDISRTQLGSIEFDEEFSKNKHKIAQLLAERKLRNKSSGKLRFEIRAVSDTEQNSDELIYLNKLLKEYPESLLQKIGRALINWSLYMKKNSCDAIELKENFIAKDQAILECEIDRKQKILLLFAPENDEISMLNTLMNEGLLLQNSTNSSIRYTFTIKGCKYIEEIESGKKMTTEKSTTYHNTFYGDGNNIAQGEFNDSQISQTANQVIAGNIESLKQHLLSQGFKQDDVDALENALNQDKENGIYTIRSHVKGWFEKIKQKCIDSVYTIPHETFVGVATAAILKLCGI